MVYISHFKYFSPIFSLNWRENNRDLYLLFYSLFCFPQFSLKPNMIKEKNVDFFSLKKKILHGPSPYIYIAVEY